MMTLAKGITNAAVPMGAVCLRRGIYDAIVDGAPAGIELFHGYTYSGHPLAAAAGLATLDLYKYRRARSIAPRRSSRSLGRRRAFASRTRRT